MRRFITAESIWIDFHQILIINSLDERNHIFGSPAKLDKGFWEVGVRNLAFPSPIDFGIGF